MIHCIRTAYSNKDFQFLVTELDAYLRIVDGKEHLFYAQYNKIDAMKYVVLAYEQNIPVGCGSLREYSSNTIEVKRMFVPEKERGKGIATKVLAELEKWAKELGYEKCILETGEKQPEAIGLYKKNGYKLIPNYGQYKNVYQSVCFEKVLKNLSPITPPAS
jgi:GNAT superfamily N-acetyltransferase